MSRLSKGDEPLHYSDGSHRWIPPRDMPPEKWAAIVAEHLERHRRSFIEVRPQPDTHPCARRAQ